MRVSPCCRSCAIVQFIVTGFGVSMLKRLADAFPGAIAKLTTQYRMNESICHLSNIIGERPGVQYVLHFHPCQHAHTSSFQ